MMGLVIGLLVVCVCILAIVCLIRLMWSGF